MIEKRKRLYRSCNDRMVAGVLGGWSQHLGLDPSLLRLAFVILVILTGFFPGIFLPLVVALVVPLAPMAGALVEVAEGLGLDRSYLRGVYLTGTMLAAFVPAIFLYMVMAIIVPLEPKSQVAEAGAAS